MLKLPTPLQPMGDYAQFILYKKVPKPDGKTDKLPVDPRTLDVYAKGSGWQQDPTAWTTFDNAQALAARSGLDVGFFFTPDDPFFFVDIDNCNTGQQWSNIANDIMRRLSGAAIEVSQSGTGLHIFGQYAGTVPPHTCKNTPLDLEFYTQGRFVALTGDRAMGNALVDCTAALPDLIATYYTPREHAEPSDWTTEPTADYTGPSDDKELIKRACASRSTASMFGNAATFKMLWEADDDALAAAYPATDGRSYDASSADAALAQHLAFWTGKNCARMLGLMRESALVRDKWERADYLERTILFAVSVQKAVYSIPEVDPAIAPNLQGTAKQKAVALRVVSAKLAECGNDVAAIEAITSGKGLLKGAAYWIESKDKPVAEIIEAAKPVSAAVDPFGSADEPTVTAGYQFLGPEQQMEFFGGCTYIQDIHRVFTPKGMMLKSEQFNATFGGYVFQLDDSGSKTTRKAFEAFTESQVVRYPKAESTCFRPLLAPGKLLKEDDRLLVNTYVPAKTPRKKGDPGRFLGHLDKILPDATDQQILLAYMAACVQHKGVKFQWAPLLQGVQGNGKTLFTRCVAAAIGKKHTHLPRASEIDEKFNSWLFNMLFIGVEDIYVPNQKREIIEILKPMITGEWLACRAMQQDQAMKDVCCNFIFNSNHRDAIRKTRNDRRFAIFYTAQQDRDDKIRDGLTKNYFSGPSGIYRWLETEGYAIVTDFLHTYPIPEEFNPANGWEAPVTSTTDEAIEAGIGGVEQEIIEAIEEGRPGFANGWVSSMALELLLRAKRKDMAVTINRRRDILRSLGYEWHPALNSGRVNNPVAPDNGKPRLFIHINSPDRAIDTAAAVAIAYQSAQSAVMGGTA